jgi:hypothetical protein
MSWRLCNGQEVRVKPVAVSELMRLARRASAITVTEQTGRKSTGTQLGVEPQGKITVHDIAKTKVFIDCNTISEIELKSNRRSVGSRIAQWGVVAGGGSVSIAAGVAVHPAFFGGIPAALLVGRRIETRSKKVTTVVVKPQCSTFP